MPRLRDDERRFRDAMKRTHNDSGVAAQAAKIPAKSVPLFLRRMGLLPEREPRLKAPPLSATTKAAKTKPSEPVTKDAASNG